jgi:hypothetical protein
MGVRSVSFVALAAASACVQPLSGSDVQIDFGASGTSIWVPARNAATQQANQPAPNTYYRLYAVQERRDASNVVVENYVFPVQDLEIRHLIDLTSPCFIELEDARFPGLHATEFENKVKEVVNIQDEFHPRADATQAEIDQVVDADIRMGHLSALQDTVEVVTDTSNAQYGGSAATCLDDDAGVDQTLFPPPKCTGDRANALRLKLCREFWAKNPSFYEGSDKVFTLPLNGEFRGVVEGINPVNNGFLGGSEFVVDTVLSEVNSFVLTWQYKDLNGDGTPDFPASTPEADKKIGHTYLTGRPVRAARGVINVLLSNPADPSISAEMAIFSDISNRGTHF